VLWATNLIFSVGYQSFSENEKVNYRLGIIKKREDQMVVLEYELQSVKERS